MCYIVVIYELKGERRTSGQGDFRGAVGCEGKNRVGWDIMVALISLEATKRCIQ